MRHHCPDVKLETGEIVQERFWPIRGPSSLSTGQKMSGKRFSISKEERGSFWETGEGEADFWGFSFLIGYWLSLIFLF